MIAFISRGKKPLISIAQIRAARGLLGWSQNELAKAAGVSGPTVRRVETDQGVKVSQESMSAIRTALEKAGVIFVEENGDGPGVRLRKARQHHPVDDGAPRPKPVSTRPAAPKSRRRGR